MSAPLPIEQTAEASPRVRARIAGVFYLLTIVIGAVAVSVASVRLAANLIATLCYIAVTLLFYGMFKPVSRSISSLAAAVSLVGCAISALGAFHLVPSRINPLVFFGFYCLLIGYLIFRSTFLPRSLGLLMAFGGIGWLTFLSPSLASHLFPYNMAPGLLGEGSLTLWLLVAGVNVQRWNAAAEVVRSKDD